MKGNVISRDESGITIALSHSPEDGCRACGLGESCSLPKSEKIRVDLNHHTKTLNINDIVDVEISSRRFLWLSASVYILPLVTMLAGGIFGMRYSENMGILGAIGGLAAGIMFNIKLNKVLSVHDIVDIRRTR
jgi:positive regulator of sigma E activity